jgi:uncharacterized protein (TIGR03435 family)
LRNLHFEMPAQLFRNRAKNLLVTGVIRSKAKDLLFVIINQTSNPLAGQKISTILTSLLLAFFASTPLAQSTSPAPLQPMPPDASPAFDVATIKPSDTSAPHGTFIRHNGRQIVAYNMSLGHLITYAYSLHTSQIVDGSSSLLSTHFDIDGVPDIDGHPNISQTRLMFQKLLVSRFKLTFHHESRELSVYAIQVAKNGRKLAATTSKPGDSTHFTFSCPPDLIVRNYSIPDFAKAMQDVFLDKPTVDQTGLKDRYDFDLKWASDDSQTYCPAAPERSRDDPSAPPSLYTAIQEQLGLKLVSTKAPVQVLVIDHVEKPSEN